MRNQNVKQDHIADANKMVIMPEIFANHIVGINNMVTELLPCKGD